MKDDQRKKLEAAGWRIGTAEEFLAEELAPDLIEFSGRENMPVSERAALLAHDLMYPPFTLIPEVKFGLTGTPAYLQNIHDLKLTVGWIRNLITLYERAVARGENNETLAKGANRFFSQIECRVLAWRRGGHQEFVRVLKLQKEH